MRIITWNMGSASARYGARYRKVREEAWSFVLSFDPEVVLAQEAVFDVPDCVRAEWRVFSQERAYDGQDAGCLIMVRASGPIAGSRPATVAGSYVAAVELPMGSSPLVLLSVHVGTTRHRDNLRALVEALPRIVGAQRFVVAGDFNASRAWDLMDLALDEAREAREGSS